MIALVTGASSGIGRDIARELAKRKYDLIIVDVANNYGIDSRFLNEDYFISVKKSLKKNGIFISNMCASPDFNNRKNKFFTGFFPKYTKFFKNNLVFKGNYSDKIYYKCFFDIDERVIDITNVIIISSDKNYCLKSNYQKFNNLNIDITNYLRDLQ